MGTSLIIGTYARSTTPYEDWRTGQRILIGTMQSKLRRCISADNHALDPWPMVCRAEYCTQGGWRSEPRTLSAFEVFLSPDHKVLRADEHGRSWRLRTVYKADISGKGAVGGTTEDKVRNGADRSAAVRVLPTRFASNGMPSPEQESRRVLRTTAFGKFLLKRSIEELSGTHFRRSSPSHRSHGPVSNLT